MEEVVNTEGAVVVCMVVAGIVDGIIIPMIGMEDMVILTITIHIHLLTTIVVTTIQTADTIITHSLLQVHTIITLRVVNTLSQQTLSITI